MTEEGRKARAAYAKEYRQKNKDKLNQYRREWNRKNPDKVRQYQMTYWEKQANQENGGEADDK